MSRRAIGGADRKQDALGFTLVELLVVFALLALLLSIAVPRYLNSTEAAAHNVRQQNLATLRDAIDKFKADQGRYPNELTELVQRQYLRDLPLDPVSKSNSWTVVKHPSNAESGIYDVTPPVMNTAEGTSAPQAVQVQESAR